MQKNWEDTPSATLRINSVNVTKCFQISEYMYCDRAVEYYKIRGFNYHLIDDLQGTLRFN